MQHDKVEQLKSAMKAQKEAEERVRASSESTGLSVGIEEQYQAKIAELESKLKQAEEETKEAHDKYVRIYAEFENFRRRSNREKEEGLRYAHEKLFKELLPVIDALEQALTHAESTDKTAIISGVQLVLKHLHKIMESFGVTPVEALGKAFDPHHHEAVLHHESEEHEPHSVITEHRRGYKLHDRLIRPSLVTVAKPPTGEKK